MDQEVLPIGVVSSSAPRVNKHEVLPFEFGQSSSMPCVNGDVPSRGATSGFTGPHDACGGCYDGSCSGPCGLTLSEVEVIETAKDISIPAAHQAVGYRS